MKKKRLLLSVFVLLTQSLHAQFIPKIISKVGVYLGLNGGYYKTEVKIPIQQIRWQDPNHKDTVKFIDYTKTIDNVKYVEPYIAEKTNYSLFTDPQTGTMLIGIRPIVVYASKNGLGAPLDVTLHHFPLDSPAMTSSTAISCDSIVIKKYDSIDAKSNTTSTSYTTNTTKTNIKLDTTKVNIPNITTISFKAQTSLENNIAIKSIPEVDPNATAIIGSSDTISKFHLNTKAYLFVPDGNKMPNFSQQLINQWFFSGPLSLLVRIRPRVPAYQQLEPLPNGLVSSGLNLGFLTGAKHMLVGLNNGGYYKSPLIYQFPMFMIGVNNTDITKRIDTNNDGLYDNYSAKENDVIFSYGTGAGIQYGSLSFYGLFGFDHLFGVAKDAWAYQGKLWYGFSIGVSLDKLVGLTK